MKIFITGGEGINWATDDDASELRRAVEQIEGIYITENINDADIIHSVHWSSIESINPKTRKDKTIVATVPHDVRAMIGSPKYLNVVKDINLWIAPSTKALSYFSDIGLRAEYVPYSYRGDFYKKLLVSRTALRKKYNLPENAYIIGSFQRDTENSDLVSPKLVKGPDILAEILKYVYERGKNIHVLLAGPRRHWIKKKLKEYGIPYTYVGQEIEGDDLDQNNLSHDIVNELYNCIDLYIVGSRMEGGPKAVMESIATDTKIISTDVGIAKDLLKPEQIFSNLIEGGDKVIQDIEENSLENFKISNQTALKNHATENISSIYASIYPASQKQSAKQELNVTYRDFKKPKDNFFSRFINRYDLGLTYETKEGAWGGANQFIKALRKELSRLNVSISNTLNAKTIFINSFHYPEGLLDNEKFKNKIVLHRIDGPTSLVRGDNIEKEDTDLFELNSKAADITIFQSFWSFQKNLKLGYKPVNPVLISNASDQDIFYSQGKKEISNKIKIISSSWSDNPNKGLETYKWLDSNLDFSKIEYTFIGRIKGEFKNIKVLPPVDSEELARHLNNANIYLTASINDPCSNAVIEALSCGLPVIYANSGGHPELVQFGGLGFNSNDEIPAIIDVISSNYTYFENLVRANDINEISGKYMSLIKMRN